VCMCGCVCVSVDACVCAKGRDSTRTCVSVRHTYGGR